MLKQLIHVGCMDVILKLLAQIIVPTAYSHADYTQKIQAKISISLQDFSPCQVTEMRVYGAADNLTADFAELLCPVAESYDLSGTHKCEVQGVEEEDHILP